MARLALLFLLSVTLVAGFWFHGEFYQLGLFPLLLVGGFLTFLVLLSLQRLAIGKPFGRSPRRSLSLPREAVGRALDGTQTLAIVSLGASYPPAGSLAKVAFEDERPVARMRIEDVRRCLLEDLEHSDVVAAGFEGLDDFHGTWSRGGVRDPHEILLLIGFHTEAHR